jgi:hypothetical protein
MEDLKKAKQYIDFIIEKEGTPKVTDTKDDWLRKRWVAYWLW